MFIFSTHYDGNEPDDAIQFWKDANSGKLDMFFDKKKIMIYGLGDSNYSKFSQFAHDFNDFAKKSGAEMFVH